MEKYFLLTAIIIFGVAVLIQGTFIMGILQDLQAKVAKNTEVEQSAVELLGGLKTKLDEAIATGDFAVLGALSAQLEKDTANLAAAVVANTPAE